MNFFNTEISDRKSNVLWRLAAVCYALVLLGFNFVRIFDNNFWLDEAFSINLARMSFVEMIQATAADVHPPLYYAFLMLMQRLFGDYGWLFHLTSLIPYVIVMVFILSVIWWDFGKGTAFLMMTFVSMMRSSVVYNVEVRMYSLAAMFVLFAFYSLYLIFKENKLSGWFLSGFFSICAIYTHYCTMIPIMIFYFFLLVFTLIKRQKKIRIFMLYLITAVLYLPWLGIFLSTVKRASANFERDYISLAKGIVNFFWLRQEWYALLVWLIFVAALIVLVLSEIKNRKKEESLRIYLSEIPHDIYWIFCGFAASTGTLIAYEAASFLIRPCFSYKYLHPVLAVLWLVFSVVLSKIRFGNKIAMLLAAVTFFASLPMYSEIYEADSVSAEESEKTLRLISESIAKEDVLSTNIRHLDWGVLEYYFPDKKHRYSENIEGIRDVAKEAPGWIFWSEELSKEKLEQLSGQNYEIESKCASCVLGDNRFYLYYIKKL